MKWYIFAHCKCMFFYTKKNSQKNKQIYDIYTIIFICKFFQAIFTHLKLCYTDFDLPDLQPSSGCITQYKWNILLKTSNWGGGGDSTIQG